MAKRKKGRKENRKRTMANELSKPTNRSTIRRPGNVGLHITRKMASDFWRIFIVSVGFSWVFYSFSRVFLHCVCWCWSSFWCRSVSGCGRLLYQLFVRVQFDSIRFDLIRSLILSTFDTTHMPVRHHQDFFYFLLIFVYVFFFTKNQLKRSWIN